MNPRGNGGVSGCGQNIDQPTAQRADKRLSLDARVQPFIGGPIRIPAVCPHHGVGEGEKESYYGGGSGEPITGRTEMGTDDAGKA